MKVTSNNKKKEFVITIIQILLGCVAVVYTVAPDLIPGPIDDALVIALVRFIDGVLQKRKVQLVEAKS